MSIESWTQCSDCGFNLGQGHELLPPVTEQLPVGAECPKCGEPMHRVVPLSEVRETLLGEEAVEAVAECRWYQRFIGEPWSEADPKRREECMTEARRYLEMAQSAAFPSTDSEGQK